MFNSKTLLTSLTFSALVIGACKKPTDGVIPVVSNVGGYAVSVLIADANSSAANQVPAGLSVTLTGDAIDKDLIVNYGDNTSTGTVNVSSTGGVALAVKTGTTVKKNAPLRFTITASAPGFISNSREVVITGADSSQSLGLKLVNLATPPAGVALKQTNVGITGGVVGTKTTVDVNRSGAGSTAGSLTIPAGVQLRDGNGANITGSGNAAVVFGSYSSSSPDAFNAIPGGTSRVKDSNGKEYSFIVADAFTINMNVGTTPVKSFTVPLSLDVNLNPNSYNSKTGAAIKAGDALEVWSVSEGSSTWTREKDVTVTSAGGVLKTSVAISHLSTYVLGYSAATCTNNTTVLITDADTYGWVAASVTIPTTGQLISSEVLYLKDTLTLNLPQNLATQLSLQQYQIDPLPAVKTSLNSCPANSYSVALKGGKTKLTLNFTLSTLCSNGLFEYTGPIDYRLSGTTTWYPFDRSNKGQLTTQALAWNFTYDFAVTYKGTTYIKTRKVLQDEFRQVLTKKETYDYWGKDPSTRQTFFYAKDVFCAK